MERLKVEHTSLLWLRLIKAIFSHLWRKMATTQSYSFRRYLARLSHLLIKGTLEASKRKNGKPIVQTKLDAKYRRRPS
jgi:hypothetical protein